MHQAIVGWNQGLTWGAPLPDLLAQHVPIPLIGITTDTKPPRREAITPAAIATGRGDAYLVAWNKAVADWGQAPSSTHVFSGSLCRRSRGTPTSP